MRINKILILGILVSSGLGLAFAQPNSSPSARDASNGSTAPAPTGDLTEVLRKKQVELDTAKNKVVAPVSSISAEKPSTMIVTAEEAQQSKLMEALHKKQADLNSTSHQTKAQIRKKAAEEKAARKQAKLEMIARTKVEQREAARKAKEEMAACKKVEQHDVAKKVKEEVATCKTQGASCVAVKQAATPQEPVPKAEISKKATVENAITQPMTRDQKLADLLRRYRADEITPHEYHEGRAKIMSEP
jgi:hypothetical protein